MSDSDCHRARLRALAHPLRLQIMSLLTGQAMSAAEAARALGCTQANVSYHLRVLRSAGYLQQAEQVSIRGGRAVRYRATSAEQLGVQPGAGAPARTCVEEYAEVAAVLAQELQRRAALRDPNQPGIFTDAELWVRPEHWQQFQHAARAASQMLHARAQPSRTPGTVRNSTTTVAFRMVSP